MNFNLFNLFKKKKEIKFPKHYAKIIFTQPAIDNGVFDVYQKEIQEIINGNIVEKISYTEADVFALRKIKKIPIIDLTKDINEEEYEFEQIQPFGEIWEVREKWFILMKF